ncbi:zonular occludens toxin domain-containing protein [Paraburkholderia bryophila]|uniref:zonular occludens toxin domain-containing protein n=1 Tax=Paraburkholderia bryophila TaxID=420952 RepID=UPI0038BC25C9
MITLITGVPGSGKTLYTVWLAEKLARSGRRVLVDGIRDLAIDHVQVDEAWVRNWHHNVQANDVVIVDEVQRYWPPMSVSTKPTEDIEKLHVHRHLGVDFIVITQHPNRMNKVIRDLVGRHVHVRRMLGLQRAMLYEWDSARNPQGNLKEAVKTWWKYPTNVFALYTSAELHTKPKAVIPKALFVIPVALIVFGLLAWKGYRSVMGFGKPGGGTVATSGGASPAASGGGSVKGVWRIVGAYALDGEAFVLVADEAGRIRPLKRDGFKGEGLRLEGEVDGQRAAVWTGSAEKSGAAK